MPTSMHNKQILLIIILQLASLLNVSAQGALCSWLSPKCVESGRQYLFRRTFLPVTDIDEAFVSLTSHGGFRLYVNGRVVLSVYEPTNSDSYTLDVSDYMRNDSNVIALWCAPDISQGLHEKEDGMFALHFHGRDVSGSQFSYSSDSTWLCAPSNAMSTSDGEIVNALEYMPDLNACTLSMPMKWSNAEAVSDEWIESKPLCFDKSLPNYKMTIRKVSSFDVDNDDKTVTYNFGHAFWGTCRVTLRNAKKGERIWIDGSEYVCRGELDEQFIGKFVCRGIRKVVITGDDKFRRSHVVKVEGISLAFE